jgi:glycosyltransferase involved in cell wall biosynthesis
MDLSSGVYAAMASRLDIADRVLFLGPHPSSRLAEVYAAADVFVLASRFDGWGAVLNEAASMGLPLVATDMCGAAWHLIEQGGNGVRVRAGSARALAEGLGRYLDHPALVKSDGARSREIFFEQFTPEANAERLLSSLAQWGGYAD